MQTDGNGLSGFHRALWQIAGKPPSWRVPRRGTYVSPDAKQRAAEPKDEAHGGLPISQKRAYLREALHAVILHPAGRGRKSFNPDLLELIWRE